MSEHDHTYRNLFSHPVMVADLLSGFVNQPWVKDADFSTLERFNGEHIARHRRRRSNDMVWRLRGHDANWVYVYLLLEFQSRTDRHMSVRILTYLGLLYQDLKRQKQLLPGGRLPAVLPIVLYNGLPRWRAAQNIAELIHPTPGLDAYIPSLRYLLLDEGALLGRHDLSPTNLATLLFQLEHEPTEDGMRDTIRALIERLRGSEFDELQRAFTAWLRDTLLPKRAPGVRIHTLRNLHEVQTMMAEQTIDWSLRWKRVGRQEGRIEGRQEGETLMLERQLTHRFGPLPADVRARLDSASTEQLKAWSLNVLDAKTLDEVFS